MGSVNPVIAPQIPDLLEGKISKLDTTEAEIRAAKTQKFIKLITIFMSVSPNCMRGSMKQRLIRVYFPKI